MSEAIEGALRAHPLPGLLLVVVMAWLEYILPPVPGDSTILFACFLAGTGYLPLSAVLAAALFGSVLGAISAYAIGSRLGRSYFFLRSDWARAELARLHRGFERFGARLLVVNRFLPGLRGFFLYAAGIGRLGWAPVLIHSTVSNVLWVGLIAWAGTSLGASWEEVRLHFGRYVWGVAALSVTYVVVTMLRAARRRSRESIESVRTER
jgi:membrane protein DedA with SNARE-associated domain